MDNKVKSFFFLIYGKCKGYQYVLRTVQETLVKIEEMSSEDNTSNILYSESQATDTQRELQHKKQSITQSEFQQEEETLAQEQQESTIIQTEEQMSSVDNQAVAIKVNQMHFHTCFDYSDRTFSTENIYLKKAFSYIT